MDTRPMRWLATEIQVLERLLLARLELEKDPNTEELDRVETFQLLSNQMKDKGFHCTVTAIERRLAGRISFRSSPTSKKAAQKHPSQPANSENRPLDSSKGVLNKKHSRSKSSSTDEIPLIQLRTKFRDSSIHVNQPEMPPASRKRVRMTNEEVQDTIVVEPRMEAQIAILHPNPVSNKPSDTVSSSSIILSQPPASVTWQTAATNKSHDNVNTLSKVLSQPFSAIRPNFAMKLSQQPPPNLASPGTSRQSLGPETLDLDKFTVYAQGMALSLKSTIEELQQKRQAQLSGKNERADELRSLEEEWQAQEAEGVALNKQVQELRIRHKATADRLKQVRNANQNEAAKVIEIDAEIETIIKKEKGIGIFLAAVASDRS